MYLCGSRHRVGETPQHQLYLPIVKVSQHVIYVGYYLQTFLPRGFQLFNGITIELVVMNIHSLHPTGPIALCLVSKDSAA